MRRYCISLLVCFIVFGVNGQEHQNINYKVEGMTVAVTKMEEMLSFYSNVFEMKFEEQEMFNSKLYSSRWGDLELLFCPAELAQNKAKQNRHQFDVVVDDLEKVIKIAKKYGGKLMGEVQNEEPWKSVGIYDPDNNSILFKEKLK